MGTDKQLAIVSATPQMVAEWDRQSRQLLARSHAVELMRNEATVEEVQAALTPEIRSNLDAALRGWEIEAEAPLQSDQGTAQLASELGRYIALTGTSMGYDAQQEWISVAIEELGHYPASLVLDAIRAARRSEPWPNKLVPAVCDKIEVQAALLGVEGERLRKLAALC